MFTLTNVLSLSRIPLSIVFLQDNAAIRVGAVFLAMITDVLDGYLARRWKTTSQLGAALDPITDKFFALCAFTALILENQLKVWEACAMLSRDIAVLLFGGFLMAKGVWGNYQFRSILCGKITTSLQFFVLIALVLRFFIPAYFYFVFIALGAFSLAELVLRDPRMRNPED